MRQDESSPILDWNRGPVPTGYGYFEFMQITRLAHVLTTLALLYVSWSPRVASAPAANVEQKAWKLEQRHFERGNSVVFLTHDAIKVVQNGYACLCKAPDWTVYCFRPKDKTIWSCKLDDFSGITLSNPWAIPRAKRVSLTDIGHSEISGLKVTEFKQGPRDHYFTADDIKVAPSVAHFLCRYYYVPETDNIPIAMQVLITNADTHKMSKQLPWLDLNMRADKNGIRKHLETRSAVITSVTARDFETPVGYQKVSEVGRVTYSLEQQDSVTNLMEDLGTASKLRGDKTGHKP